MSKSTRSLAIAVIALVCTFVPASATEMYFQPDSSFGAIGDTVNLSAWITSSDTMRGFTVYLIYDTNLVELAAPPVAGSLIAGLTGLDFRYLDHVPSAPGWLEVGATIFGTSFWAGPGELFQMRMVFRGCGDVPITASFSMRRPDGSYVPCTFNPPEFLICDRIPQAPDSLTIFSDGNTNVLRWKSVTLDTLGRALIVPPLYRILRNQLAPAVLPYVVIDSTLSTSFIDVTINGDIEWYYIEAVGQ